MAWLPTGLTAIVVCDHGSVKPTGVRVGAGRQGHLPATTAEVRATAMPKVHRHAQVRQCVERRGEQPRVSECEPAVCSTAKLCGLSHVMGVLRADGYSPRTSGAFSEHRMAAR